MITPKQTFMRKLLLILPLLFWAAFFYAQLSFTLADPQPDLLDMYSGSSASGDIDGDGDNDLIMTGITPGLVTVFYLNDGAGNFTEMMDTPLRNVGAGEVKLEDLDGDGDLDLFASGQLNSSNGFVHVYLNDGAGTFTLLENPALPQLFNSGSDLADVDGDGDMDLLIFANTVVDGGTAGLFLNDGNAVFSASDGIDVIDLEVAFPIFLDADNDGDPDALIAGRIDFGMGFTQLYLNDGTGNFDAANNTDFVTLSTDAVNAADVDNDGDIDLLMSGTTDNLIVRTILYLNDGSGRFTELPSANLQNTFSGKSSITDMDNDGDMDIVITGSQDGGLPNIYAIVYENLGANVFAPVDTVGGEYISAVLVSDFNGDELPDIIIQGFADRTNVYWNTTVLTSVNDFSSAPPLTIFPNPSSGRLVVDLEDEMTDLSLNIYSITGQQVYRQPQVAGTRVELQLDLSAGTYMVVLRSGDLIVNRKMLIIR